MSAHETVEITGHLMDHGILSLVLDDIREYSGDYTIDANATHFGVATVKLSA